MSDNSHHESHAGQSHPKKQMLITGLLSFLIPIALIASLVSVFSSKPLVPVSAEGQEMAVAKRIQKVGAVDIKVAGSGGDGGAKQLRSGEDVFKAQCSSCHATGAAGAPKVADGGAWAPRVKNGFEALLASAMKGKGNMPAQGGGDLDDLEVARGVVYLANAGGAKFAEPKAAAK